MTINRYSKLDGYPLPKAEDLFTTLTGGQTFTKLDLTNAYAQMELDDDSKPYTCINTQRGLHMDNRCPFWHMLYCTNLPTQDGDIIENGTKDGRISGRHTSDWQVTT